MALEMASGVIHLIEASSGRTVARLTDPHGDRASWQAFTPDCTRLVTVAGLASAVHIWDLRAIRMRLKMMNLDWDWPEFPPDAVKLPLTRKSSAIEKRALLRTRFLFFSPLFLSSWRTS